MNKLVARYGELTLSKSNDFFVDLSRSIVGQQLSAKVARVIWERIRSLFNNDITPLNFLNMKNEPFRAVGLSASKTQYIKNLSKAIIDGALKLDNLQIYDDEEVVKKLTTIKGIGRWTAEMFLIFSLARPDVFSFGDAGLYRAIKTLYGDNQDLTKEQIQKISDKWKPWRSYASLYLWQSLDNT